MTKYKKLNLHKILKYLTFAFLCLILANARIGDLSPMLFAFYFACVFVGIDEKLISCFVLFSALAISFTLQNFLITISIIAVALIMFYIHKFFKKKIRLVTVFITYLISNVTYVYYNHTNLKHLIFYFLLGLICLFVYIVVLQVMFLRKNCFKLTLNETICYMFTIATLGLGFAPVSIFNFQIYRLFIMLAILICVAIGSSSLTYSVTLSFLLGVALTNMSLEVVAEFMIIALLTGVFALPNKFKMVLVVILTDIFTQYIFLSNSVNVLYAILPIILACAIFILLPNKMLNSLADLVYVKKSEMSSRNLINITRKNIKKRMVELSNVFLEMKQIHANMVKKELNKEELIDMLTREVLSCCCKDCLDKNRCTRSLGTDNKSNLAIMLEIAVTKGKITLLDIPSGLSNRCAKINNLVALINRLSDEYKQYKNIMTDVNNVKYLMAEQMGAVSRLLLDVGDEIDTNVRFDIARENKIISRLLSSNIQCREVLLYTEKNNDISAVLIVKSDNSYNPIIEKTLTEVLKVPMQITKISPLEESDYNSIHLKKLSKYDCVFGLASCNKSGNLECGDCHSIIRLGGNKFLLALCDGMGAGKNAHKMSAMTLGLIENFYKVGFDNDIILESVNKLLAINNQENYSTLDVCLIDLENEIADFVKVGAPFGLIKRKSNIEIVEGGALPIGALDNIEPATYKTTISTKDIIIMATDGIVDAFETTNALIDYVSGLATNNPQTIAEAILNEALTLNEMSAKDDMTVLVARTYLKN